jgi:hypothetical protein
MFVGNLDIRMVTPPTLSLNKLVYLITVHSAVPLYSGRVIEYRLIEIYGIKSEPVMNIYPESYRHINDMYLKMAFAEIMEDDGKYVSDKMLV